MKTGWDFTTRNNFIRQSIIKLEPAADTLLYLFVTLYLPCKLRIYQYSLGLFNKRHLFGQPKSNLTFNALKRNKSKGYETIKVTTRDFIFMFWIFANNCAFLLIYLFRECLVNKLNYGILHQLPATSGHIKSKQQTFTLIFTQRFFSSFFFTFDGEIKHAHKHFLIQKCFFMSQSRIVLLVLKIGLYNSSLVYLILIIIKCIHIKLFLRSSKRLNTTV